MASVKTKHLLESIILQKTHLSPSALQYLHVSGCGQLSKCPSGFHQFDNYCYRLGETLMSKSDGKVKVMFYVCSGSWW